MAIGQTNASAGGGGATLANIAYTGSGSDIVDKNSTSTYSMRESKITNTEQSPTSNGQIVWVYE